MMYYNTNDESGDTLKRSRAQSSKQGRAILAFFQERDGEFTPFEVRDILGWEAIPITSIRRAITVLTKAGHLKKTATMRIGLYGKLNHCWTKKGQEGRQ